MNVRRKPRIIYHHYFVATRTRDGYVYEAITPTPDSRKKLTVEKISESTFQCRMAMLKLQNIFVEVFGGPETGMHYNLPTLVAPDVKDSSQEELTDMDILGDLY